MKEMPYLHPLFIEAWNNDERIRISAFLIKVIATGNEAESKWARSSILKLKKMSESSAISEFSRLLEREKPELCKEFEEFIEFDEMVRRLRTTSGKN
jgi:hypothetical protein